MSSVQHSIQHLHNAYTIFCIMNMATGSDIDNRNQLIKNFTEIFMNSTSSPEMLPLQSRMYSLQKRWVLICQELVDNPSEIPPTCLQRMNKLSQKIMQLREVALKAPAPSEKTAAEEIADLITDTHIKEIHIEKSFSGAINDLSKRYPKAIQATEAMIQRIMQGVYGPRLKNLMYDSLKCPLLLKDRFCKMLFVDLVMRGQDPIASCEWFRKCPKKPTQAVAKGLLDLKVDLLAKYCLPECEVLGAFMVKSDFFSPVIKESFDEVRKEFSFGTESHQDVLLRFGHYYNPSNITLTNIAICLAAHKKIERALRVVTHVQGTLKERKIHIELLAKVAFKHNFSQTLVSLRPYQTKDRQVWVVGMNLYVKGLIEGGKLHDLRSAIQQLAIFRGTPTYVKRSRDCIASCVKNDIENEMSAYLITSHASLEDRLTCLEAFISAQFTKLSTEKQSTDSPKAYEVSLAFLTRYRLSDADGMAALAFACAKAGSSKHFRAALAEIWQPHVRQLLFQRTVPALFTLLGEEEAYNWFLDLSKRLPKEEDKQFLYRSWAEELVREDDKRALAIADQLQDEGARTHIKLLWKDRKAQPHPFHFEQMLGSFEILDISSL